MIHENTYSSFNLVPQTTSTLHAIISIQKNIVDALYTKALQAQKNEALTYGFSQGATPLSYIEATFKPHLLNHIQNVLLTHCVIRFLKQGIRKHKLVLANGPRLIDITIKPHSDAIFVFELQPFNPVLKNDWKKFVFKAPERKNYKDLDRQVEFFLKEENAREATASDAITIGDWICFNIMLLDEKGTTLLAGYIDTVWLKIGDEEADKEAQSLFLNKKVGDSFITDHSFLQSSINNDLTTPYMCNITIIERVPHGVFSLPLFKKHFKLKTAKDVHLKLIEIFSYRNDLSQRRETVEAALKLILNHHPLVLHPTILQEQKNHVLKEVHDNPDYHVYKAQHDFKEKVTRLAEKQLKEAILIDAIGFNEDIVLTQEDIMSYLNFMKRPRTKEFIYFDLPSTKIQEQEMPVCEDMLAQFCLREKTINHIIYHLTKKA